LETGFPSRTLSKKKGNIMGLNKIRKRRTTLKLMFKGTHQRDTKEDLPKRNYKETDTPVRNQDYIDRTNLEGITSEWRYENLALGGRYRGVGLLSPVFSLKLGVSTEWDDSLS